jgi:hypothetical protein
MPNSWTCVGKKGLRFAVDSPVEESGFEPLVPLTPKRERCRIGGGPVTSSENSGGAGDASLSGSTASDYGARQNDDRRHDLHRKATPADKSHYHGASVRMMSAPHTTSFSAIRSSDAGTGVAPVARVRHLPDPRLQLLPLVEIKPALYHPKFCRQTAARRGSPSALSATP